MKISFFRREDINQQLQIFGDPFLFFLKGCLCFSTWWNTELLCFDENLRVTKCKCSFPLQRGQHCIMFLQATNVNYCSLQIFLPMALRCLQWSGHSKWHSWKENNVVISLIILQSDDCLLSIQSCMKNIVLFVLSVFPLEFCLLAFQK